MSVGLSHYILFRRDNILLMHYFEDSLAELDHSHRKRLPPIEGRTAPALPKVEFLHQDHDFDHSTSSIISEQPQRQHSNDYLNTEVPVVKFVQLKQSLKVFSSRQYKQYQQAKKPPASNATNQDKRKDKQSSKEKKKVPYMIGRGKLRGNCSIQEFLEVKIDFQGEFIGTFQMKENNSYPQMYFEGEIRNLKVLRAYPNQSHKYNSQEIQQAIQKQQNDNLAGFEGFFKGHFIQTDENGTVKQYRDSFLRNFDTQFIQKDKKDAQYHVPTMVHFDIRKINQINLEKSSAKISAILYIDVQLSKEVLEEIYNFKTKNFIEKLKLTIDTHRGRVMVLPFYNKDDFDDTDEEEQYEWDDVWDGIDMEAEWNEKLMRMSYSIRTVYTAEIDNSHGIFYAPFNLNMLRIIVDLHNIKVKKKKLEIHLNCCDLTDYNKNTNRGYTPYTFFQKLDRDLYNYHIQNKEEHAGIYRKHIDRLTKIDMTHFEDQGEFKIANNRLSLFPYHKRVLKNRNTLTADFKWSLGTASRSENIKSPEVTSVVEGYAFYKQKKERRMFKLEHWQFVHLEMPIYKYPVIDMIRIFVPIIILSAISLTIFAQENAKDANNFTEAAKRIASSCNLMIAYVALIPMISSGLPPSPSITLIEILIYLSVIPNILAIISVFYCASADYLQFFATYQPFTDGLFLASFILSCLSFIVLGLVMLIYAYKDYKSDYTIYKFEPSPMRNLRAPSFFTYINKLKQQRQDVIVEEFKIPYDDLQRAEATPEQ